MSARRQLSKSLRKEILSFGLVPSHSQFRTREEVIDNLGCQAMAVLFGGIGTDSLATMRYNIYSKKVVSASSFVSPERLPPPQPNLLPNVIVVEHTTRSWSGQENRRVWIPGTGGGTCKTIGSSQLCQR